MVAFVPPAKWKGGYPCFAVTLPVLVCIVYLMKEVGGYQQLRRRIMKQVWCVCFPAQGNRMRAQW